MSKFGAAIRQNQDYEQANISQITFVDFKNKKLIENPKINSNAIKAEEIQTDTNTGKQYVTRIDKNGRNIQIPVSPDNTATDPIRSLEDLRKLDKYLYTKGQKVTRARDYAYFIFSLNMWRRAGDTLKIKVCEVMNPDGTIKDHLYITEAKTGKKTYTVINQELKTVLAEYLAARKNLSMEDYLFPRTTPKYGWLDKEETQWGELPLEVQAMRRMLQRAAKAVGITNIHIGTHTLRKTGAYHAWQNATAQEREIITQILGHSDQQTTQTYIGEAQETIDDFMERCSAKINHNLSYCLNQDTACIKN